MEAKKRLGQHFLINKAVAFKIAQRLKGSDFIVEIGGGKGALTEELIRLGVRILVVELDEQLADLLRRKFRDCKNVFVIRGDGRCFKLAKPATVVGNLPYNISKAIIRNFILQYLVVEKMVFMVQKEVAQAIVAKVGRRDFSKFSVLSQLFFDTEKLFDVSKGSFIPKPKVESSVVEFTKKDNIVEIDESFFDFLNRLFAHPRKTIKNNIEIPLDDETSRKRPSNLSLEEIYNLWRTRWQNM